MDSEVGHALGTAGKDQPPAEPEAVVAGFLRAPVAQLRVCEDPEDDVLCVKGGRREEAGMAGTGRHTSR